MSLATQLFALILASDRAFLKQKCHADPTHPLTPKESESIASRKRTLGGIRFLRIRELPHLNIIEQIATTTAVTVAANTPVMIVETRGIASNAKEISSSPSSFPPPVLALRRPPPRVSSADPSGGS